MPYLRVQVDPGPFGRHTSELGRILAEAKSSIFCVVFNLDTSIATRAQSQPWAIAHRSVEREGFSFRHVYDALRVPSHLTDLIDHPVITS